MNKLGGFISKLLVLLVWCGLAAPISAQEANWHSTKEISFSGTKIDENVWNVDLTSKGKIIQNNGLIFQTDSSVSYSSPRMHYRKLFKGNFEIVVHWSLPEKISPPQKEHSDIAHLGVSIDKDDFSIARIIGANNTMDGILAGRIGEKDMAYVNNNEV